MYLKSYDYQLHNNGHGIMLRANTYAIQPCAMAAHDCDGEPTVTLTRVMIMPTYATNYCQDSA